MADSLEVVAKEVLTCSKCPLHSGRTNSVPGEGPANAKIMFIGEGPGFHEDQSGRPFVGASGNFLSEMLEMIDLNRSEVFIANLVKCRPPGNRDPEPIEIETCTTSYLYRQIELIDPRVIVTLGRFSMALWFPSAKISHIHGRPKKVDNRLIVPFFHPAAALHQRNLRETLIEDFKKLPEFVAQVEAGLRDAQDTSDEPPPDELQQLSLF